MAFVDSRRHFRRFGNRVKSCFFSERKFFNTHDDEWFTYFSNLRHLIMSRREMKNDWKGYEKCFKIHYENLIYINLNVMLRRKLFPLLIFEYEKFLRFLRAKFNFKFINFTFLILNQIKDVLERSGELYLSTK